jgi:hypothetical protein
MMKIILVFVAVLGMSYGLLNTKFQNAIQKNLGAFKLMKLCYNLIRKLTFFCNRDCRTFNCDFHIVFDKQEAYLMSLMQQQLPHSISFTIHFNRSNNV